MKKGVIICPKCKRFVGNHSGRGIQYKGCRICLFISQDIRETKLIPKKADKQTQVEVEMRKYLYDLDMLSKH